MALLKEADVAYATFQNIVADDPAAWTEGKPTQETIDKLVSAWKLDRLEPYSILGWRLITADDVAVRVEPPAGGYPEAPTPLAARVFRLLAAPDAMVSQRRKDMIDRALRRALDDDREYAVETGASYYDDVDNGASKVDGTA